MYLGLAASVQQAWRLELRRKVGRRGASDGSGPRVIDAQGSTVHLRSKRASWYSTRAVGVMRLCIVEGIKSNL